LQDLCDVQIDESLVRISGNTFDAEIDRVKYQWEPREDGIDLVKDAKVTIGRRALDRNTYTTPRVVAQQNPSVYAHEQQQNTETNIKAQVAAEQVSKPIDLGYHKRANELGTLVHRAIELVMSGKDSVESYKSRLESALKEFLSSQQIEEVWSHARELRDHLESVGIDRSISVEVPVIGRLNDSTIAVGSIDLLATGGALKLIIDHKTDSKIELLDDVWAAHRAQLEFYQKLLPEYGIALNLVRSGQLIHAAGN
jgi:ATP-dependent exoDNAse (exonuclease V) beta subunit